MDRSAFDLISLFSSCVTCTSVMQDGDKEKNKQKYEFGTSLNRVREADCKQTEKAEPDKSTLKEKG